MTDEMLKDTVDIIGVDTSVLPKKKSSSKKTKKNFETLMQPCGVLEADFALQQQFKEYSCKHLETVTNRIIQCVYNVTSNFLEIGFRLYECEHYKYYAEAGYGSVCDYALKARVRKKVLKTIKADWVNLCMYGLEPFWVSLKAVSNFAK